MTEHIEEQEMEAEALAAIFDTAFEITRNEQPFEWSVSLYPVDTHDEVEREEVNNVACRVQVELPLTYPDVLPIINVEVIKGLADEHQQKLQVIAAEEAESYMGMVAIYAVCEAIRTWLVDNNVKGLDDVSMHAQMLRKQMEAEQNKVRSLKQYIAARYTGTIVCTMSVSGSKNKQIDSNAFNCLIRFMKSRFFITNTGSL